MRAMPADRTHQKQEATRKRAALLVSWTQHQFFGRKYFPAAARLQAAREKALPRALTCHVFSHNGGSVGLGNRTNKGENKQGKDLERNKSLDLALRRAANASTDINEFISGFGPSVICCAGPNFDAQIPSTVTDLRLTEGRNVGADPIRWLRDSHVPVDPSALFVGKGHAGDGINRLESNSHRTRAGRRWREQNRQRRQKQISGETSAFEVQAEERLTLIIQKQARRPQCTSNHSRGNPDGHLSSAN